MSLTNAQKQHLRYLCADAMNRIDWMAELAELNGHEGAEVLPESNELWAYLRQTERRIFTTLGDPQPVLWH